MTQRLNLLKLVPEVQAAVRGGELPVREVRELHRAAPAEQLAALRRWRQLVASRERRNEQSSVATMPRPSRVAAPFLHLGDNRAKIAARLRAEVPVERRHVVAEELRALAEDLLRDEG